MNEQTIPISALTLDPELQPRAVMDADLIDEYADAMSEGAEFPAVVAFRDGAVFLVDGFHRVAACQRLGRSEVTAVVHDGTREQALRYALSANAAHGARRSPGDLIRAYDTAVRNGLVDPGDANAVQAMIHCSPRWATELTQPARTATRDKRDAEVLKKMREGKSQREIAEEMALPRSTVRGAVERVGEKRIMPIASTSEEPRATHPPDDLNGSQRVDAADTDTGAPHGLILHAEAKHALAACLAECYADGPYSAVAVLYKRAVAAMQKASESYDQVRAAVAKWKFGDSLKPVAALGYLAQDYSTINMLHQIYAHLDRKGWLAESDGRVEVIEESP
jgi:DNA-binding NarL/FixJ family response regulator